MASTDVSYAPTHYMAHVPRVAERLARQAAVEVPHCGDGAALWLYLRSWWGRVETSAQRAAWDVFASHDALAAADVMAVALYATHAVVRGRADLPHLLGLAAHDADELEASEGAYGPSWKRRGGAGAFFQVTRKWDRLEGLCKGIGTADVLHAIRTYQGSYGDPLVNDVGDLRRYLILWLSEGAARACTPVITEPAA